MVWKNITITITACATFNAYSTAEVNNNSFIQLFIFCWFNEIVLVEAKGGAGHQARDFDLVG